MVGYVPSSLDETSPFEGRTPIKEDERENRHGNEQGTKSGRSSAEQKGKQADSLLDSCSLITEEDLTESQNQDDSGNRETQESKSK